MSAITARLLPLALCASLAACGHESVSPVPESCTYNVTASPASFGSGGGTGSASIVTGSTCAWTSRADAGWLSITGGGNGTGNGQVAFTVSANPDSTGRTGTLTVANQPVSIRQEAAAVNCTYAISPASASMNKDGGTGSFSVSTDPVCEWAAESSASWLTVVSGGQGKGSGSVTYAAPRNTTTLRRDATIRVGGQTFTFSQLGDIGGCQYSVAPVRFTPCMASVELTSDIVTQAECPWRAAAGTPWITITSGASGAGSGPLRFRVSDNYDAPRSGTVEIRWDTPTAGQNLQIAQAGCLYAVSRDAFAFDASGGNGSFDVITMSEPNTCGGATQDRCLWTATSNVAWITVTSSMPRSGDNPVSFTVAANDGSAARSGTITVRNVTVRITQAGRGH